MGPWFYLLVNTFFVETNYLSKSAWPKIVNFHLYVTDLLQFSLVFLWPLFSDYGKIGIAGGHWFRTCTTLDITFAVWNVTANTVYLQKIGLQFCQVKLL